MIDNHDLADAFNQLSTPLVADACLRLGLPLQVAPTGLRPVPSTALIAGRAAPVKHFGSVDIFLEAIAASQPGDVLVIDNSGRTDEGCIGDLTVLETRAGGLAGIVLWGCHRDTAELTRINFPVFSYGTCPAGPVRLDKREPEALSRIRFGNQEITGQDAVFADQDGAVFVAASQAQDVLVAAHAIWQTERRQAREIISGRTLRDQLKFADYLAAHAADPAYSFRQHLRKIGGAIEE